MCGLLREGGRPVNWKSAWGTALSSREQTNELGESESDSGYSTSRFWRQS